MLAPLPTGCCSKTNSNLDVQRCAFTGTIPNSISALYPGNIKCVALLITMNKQQLVSWMHGSMGRVSTGCEE